MITATNGAVSGISIPFARAILPDSQLKLLCYHHPKSVMR